MHTPQGKNVVIITIITICVLGTALWLAGVTSHAALSQLKGKNSKASGAPTHPRLPRLTSPPGYERVRNTANFRSALRSTGDRQTLRFSFFLVAPATRFPDSNQRCAVTSKSRKTITKT